MIEASLILLATVTLILGIMEVGRAFTTYNLLTHAVRDGARLGAVTPASQLSTVVPDRIKAVLRDGGVTDATVTVSFDPPPPAPVERGTAVRVRAQVDFIPIAAFIFHNASIPLQAQVVTRYE